MKRFIKQVALILAGIVITLSLLDIFYTWVISETPLHGIRKNEHVDYLIAGDSRTNPLLPEYLSQITGKKVINIGEPGYVLDDNIKVLHYFFEMGNKVDRVLLQVDWKFGARHPEDVESKEWRYLPNMIRHEGLLTPRIPFVFYAENNRNIKPMHIVKFTKTALLYNGKTDPLDTTSVRRSDRVFKENVKLLEDYSTMELRLRDIIALDTFLKRQGVKELILFSTPYLPEWISTQSDSASYKQKVRQAGYRLHDFSTVYKDTTWFKDYLHVRNSKYLDFCRLFAAVAMSDPPIQRDQPKP
jgi:hypothetical protein